MRILIFLCCCLLSFPVWAKTDFSAVIPVDVEAQNSVEAKEKGMTQYAAWYFVTTRIKLPNDE